MKVAYFDCPTGVSGDMILGALLDCGVSLDQIKAGLAQLPIGGYEISASHVNKNGITATQVEIFIQDKVTERRLGEIISIIGESQLIPVVKEKALAIFRRIGSAEAGIHGTELEQVHLHELGGQDTVIDVVGALLGMESLGVEKVYASALPLGTGTIETAHGTIPLPAPATLALLEGVPVQGSEINRELVTPTGAAILTSLADNFGRIPTMQLLKTGYGAGKMDLPVPNIVRLLVGEETESPQIVLSYQQEHLECLETNIDNMNPEIYSYLSERIFDAGALDISFIPIYMKKNRPGTLVTVLCAEGKSGRILDILFSETTTLGVRKYPVERYSLERRVTEVATPYGNVRVKFSKKGASSWDFSPEYEDCRRLALENKVALRKIYQAAEFAAQQQVMKEM